MLMSLVNSKPGGVSFTQEIISISSDQVAVPMTIGKIYHDIYNLIFQGTELLCKRANWSYFSLEAGYF